jgi:tetratricopeptide (TPR) repeat protein
MSELKGTRIYKALAVVLCLFLAFEIHYVLAYQTTEELKAQFDKAKNSYFQADYETAKLTLKNLLSTLEGIEGMDTLKGETYLLLGAAHEKLEDNNLAIKYYCLAKDVLGEGKSAEGIDLNSLPLYWTQCLTATGVSISVLIIQFEEGHQAYCGGDYENARQILENLVSQIDPLDDWDILKGETYLVLGATHEKLKDKELAIKYYCKAKDILGEGVTVDCIQLNQLRWYSASCEEAAAARVQRRRRGGFGGFIGTLLGIGILAGLIWYLFFSKNAPFKKKDGGGGDEDIITSSCFSTSWYWHLSSSWQGSSGDIVIDPDPVSAQKPYPNESNNWNDSFTFEIRAEGGGTLLSFELTIDLTVSGGENEPRRDIVTFDGVQKLDVTNSWPNSCSSPGSTVYPGVVVMNDLNDMGKTHTLGHTVQFQNLEGEIVFRPVTTTVTVTKK